jgi:hypothetical protein
MAALGHEYDMHSPVTAHEGLAAIQFDEFLREADGPILNVAAGRTDLQLALYTQGVQARVVSLDPSYTDADINAVGGEKVKGVAHDLPFADDTFATTIAHYGVQHFVPGTVGPAVREMVRVTRPVEDPLDNSGGTILIGPVFNTRKLTAEILLRGLQDVSGIQDPPDTLMKGNGLPTWVIKKTPVLEADKLDGLIEVAASTTALRPRRRTAGERMARLLHHSNV